MVCMHSTAMTMYYPTASPVGVKKASCKCAVALRQGHQQTQWKVPKMSVGPFFAMHWWYIGGTNLVSGHLGMFWCSSSLEVLSRYNSN